uniref:Uncharacterized protein n=1 Tax=Fagus sylvatica TaxID=28930 RepID=A0A2N9IGA3_FAGSY
MNSHIEKVTVYSGNGKNPMVIPEGEHLLSETDMSSNNDNRWPEGSPSEKALRRLILGWKSGMNENRSHPIDIAKGLKWTEKPESWSQKIACHPMTELETRGTWTQ